MTCPNKCRVTLLALVGSFPRVRFQMIPQIISMKRCKVTLIAFVRFFSRVSFQMSPQCPALLSRCISILIAFPKIARDKVLLAIVGLLCLFPFQIIAGRFQKRYVHSGDKYVTVKAGKVWFSHFQLLLSMSNLVVTPMTTDIFVFGGNVTHEDMAKFPLDITMGRDLLWDFWWVMIRAR